MLSSILWSSLFFLNLGQVQDPQPDGSTSSYYKIESIHLPTGFDDNDDAEVVVTGEFPNDCWKIEVVEKKQTDDGFDLKLKARKWQAFCADKMSPFLKKVSLGYLKKGIYSISNDGQKVGSLGVRAAKFKTEDDYQYANIDSAKIRYVFDKDKQKIEKRFLVIRGEFPNACYQLAKNPPVDLLSESSLGLIEILPVIERSDRLSKNCGEPVEFEEPILLPDHLNGKMLFYIRNESSHEENSIAKFFRLQSVN